jgi:hypothetical protein
MMLGPSGMPYYSGQGEQMPYPQHGYEGDARATGAPEEETKLTNVVTKNSKKKPVKDYNTNFAAVPVLVPLHSSIDPVPARTGRWAADEDTKLTDSVQLHDGKNWNAIARLVPGRTKKKCLDRWRHVLDPSIAQTPGRASKWTADEDTKLKDAVQTYNGKNWEGITRLVPGRTRIQCHNRWRDVLDARMDRTSGRTGEWTPDEDAKLKDAVHIHNGKNWPAVALLVPGRTRIQCCGRWHDALHPSVDRTIICAGEWSTDEDTKLKDAVQIHGGKNWHAVGELVASRTKLQCRGRWRNVLDPRIVRTTGRTGEFTMKEKTKS